MGTKKSLARVESHGSSLVGAFSMKARWSLKLNLSSSAGDQPRIDKATAMVARSARLIDRHFAALEGLLGRLSEAGHGPLAQRLLQEWTDKAFRAERVTYFRLSTRQCNPSEAGRALQFCETPGLAQEARCSPSNAA